MDAYVKSAVGPAMGCKEIRHFARYDRVGHRVVATLLSGLNERKTGGRGALDAHTGLETETFFGIPVSTEMAEKAFLFRS